MNYDHLCVSGRFCIILVKLECIIIIWPLKNDKYQANLSRGYLEIINVEIYIIIEATMFSSRPPKKTLYPY